MVGHQPVHRGAIALLFVPVISDSGGEILTPQTSSNIPDILLRCQSLQANGVTYETESLLNYRTEYERPSTDLDG